MLSDAWELIAAMTRIGGSLTRVPSAVFRPPAAALRPLPVSRWPLPVSRPRPGNGPVPVCGPVPVPGPSPHDRPRAVPHPLPGWPFPGWPPGFRPRRSPWPWRRPPGWPPALLRFQPRFWLLLPRLWPGPPLGLRRPGFRRPPTPGDRTLRATHGSVGRGVDRESGRASPVLLAAHGLPCPSVVSVPAPAGEVGKHSTARGVTSL
jgi:hypothetical protein